MSKLPTHARVVVVGGGIAGVSTAYHLAKLGVKDVVLLEQGKLTCGTTWHAAGLIGQTRATRNATRMSRYGIDLYASLEQETGLATGWKQCGSLNVAATPERLVSMQRQMARAKSFGIEFEFVSPAEAGRRVPILRTDDLTGAVWIPGRRQGESDRSHAVAGEGRAHARRDHRRRRQGHRRDHCRPPRCRRPVEVGRRRRRDRLRDDRQLRRPVGARVRAPRRRHGAALRRRALLPRHQGDPRRHARHAGGPRSRRLSLLQGGGRRHRHGRLRAEGQAVERGPDPRRLRVPAAARGLGSLRDPDAERDPSHALPRDGRGEAAAERAGELHARRQLHPRRSPGARRLLRLRRLQLGGHRERGRRRQARRRVDRQRRCAASTCGTSTSAASRPSTPIAGTSPTARSRRWACTTRCAGRARSWRRSARCAARRSTTGWRRRARCSAAR